MRQIILNANRSIAEFVKYGGGKAKNMALLTQKNYLVPHWFCIGTYGFDLFVKEHDLRSELRIQSENFASEAMRIEGLFSQLPMPLVIKESIAAAMKDNSLENEFVAVRSSGLDEDSPDHSFAGQYSSFLYQKGIEQLISSLKLCWASGFSERSLSYRKERSISLDGIRVGVLIQKMVNPKSAGVAFSRHPIKVLEREKVLISSVWGLGEGLVSGALDADEFEVERSSRVVDGKVANKEFKYHRCDLGGIEKVLLSDESRQAPSIDDEQIREVCDLCIKLEQDFGVPQDCEWVYENKQLFLVQTRPITNLPKDAFFDSKVNGHNPILWDNSNIVESYSGVTSPLTFSFASRAYQQVYVQFCELMGVPEDLVQEYEPIFRNMLGLIRGRIYYNLINWYQLVLMLPGSSSNKGFMETMMGVKDQVRPELKEIFKKVENPPEYSFVKRVWLTIKTFQRFVGIDSIINSFQTHFNHVYEEAKQVDFASLSLSKQMDYYHHLERQLLKRWHAPIINDYLCMLFFGLLKKLTDAWISGEVKNDTLQNDLLCGEGGLDSTEPTKCLMRIAKKIDQGEVKIRTWFLSHDPEDLWAQFQSGLGPLDIYKQFTYFLDQFGFRCVNELKLEEQDLHDDPSFVVGSVQSYIRSKSYHIEEMEKRERFIRSEAEKKVKSLIKTWQKPIYLWVLSQARKAVKNRENLRFARTKFFGISRHLFRSMGGNLCKLGHLASEKDIFFITIEELVAFVEGRALLTDFKELVNTRKREFLEYQNTPEPPERFTTQGAATAACSFTAVLAEADLLRNKFLSDDPNVFFGTPCCPGIVEGVVRVVKSLDDAKGLDGEILITARTDPGWVPLYPSCSGLIIERGSLLSHSAVVARELGLPTIVGVNGSLVSKISTGMRVRIDAGKGEVKILEQ
ncbi:MAG: PEP/pyruvate-binding domain-containing protein [Oligoflexales bacterium]